MVEYVQTCSNISLLDGHEAYGMDKANKWFSQMSQRMKNLVNIYGTYSNLA